MELGEVESLVNDLDTRVDRLRSLYDQYFMGIERLEPTVARKDVERRVQTLRKEQIRNTALRFKFQTILQRYNTYQMYWMRICRQIEDGTYRRDMLRAKARFGDPRRRSARPSADDAAAGATASSAPPVAPEAAGAAEINRAAARPPAKSTPGEDLDSGWDDDEAPTAAVARPAAKAPAPPLPPRAAAAKGSPAPSGAKPAASDDEDDEDDDRATDRAPKHRNAAALPPIPAAPPAPAVKPGMAPPPGVTAANAGTSGRAAMRIAPNVSNAPGAARPAPPEDASEARLRQVYTQYVETRRKQNESTASLSYESLATTLRASAAQLRTKHGAQRTVDFEVVVRDGKTVLKPIVR